MQNFKYLWCCLAVAVAGLLSGCSKMNPQDGAARQLDVVREHWLEEIEFQKAGATHETELDWEGALNLLYRDNLTLLRSREDIKRCRRAIRDVYLDMVVPSLGINGSMTKQVKNLSTLAPKDFKFSFTSYLGLSNIKGFFTSLYTTKLSHLRSVLAYDMAMREQTIELYKTFFEYEQLKFREENHRIQAKIAAQFATVNKRQGSLMVEESEMEAYKLEKDKKAFQVKMNRLLGSRRVNWVLKSEGLPTFDYLKNPLDIYDTEHVNQRGMQLMALELEGARLMLRGLKMQYWPSINPQINFPQLVSGDLQGKTHFFKIKDSSVGLSSYWTLDTRGRIARSIKQFKFERDMQIREARMKAQELIEKLLDAQYMLEKLDKQKGDLGRQWVLYDKLLVTQGLAQYDKILKTRKSLLDRQLQLNQQFADINTLLWMIDERRWPSLKFETYHLNDPTVRDPGRVGRSGRSRSRVSGKVEASAAQDQDMDLQDQDMDLLEDESWEDLDFSNLKEEAQKEGQGDESEAHQDLGGVEDQGLLEESAQSQDDGQGADDSEELS